MSRRTRHGDGRIPGATAFVAGFVGLVVATLGSVGTAWILMMTLAATRGIAIAGRPDAEARHVLESLQVELPVVATSLLVTALGFVGSALLAAKVARVPVREALGLGGARPALFVAGTVGIVALGPASDTLVRLFDEAFPGLSQGNLELLVGIARSQPWWIAILLLALLPGLGEEIYFRGLVQRSIRQPAIAIVVSALGFALIHLDPAHVVGVIPLGLYLAYLAHRAGSTWVTVAAHVANNTVAVVAAKTGLPGAGADEEPAPLALVLGGAVVAAAVCAYVARVTPRTSGGSTSERASATSA